MSAPPTDAPPTSEEQHWLPPWWVAGNVVLGAMIVLLVILSVLARTRIVDRGEGTDAANLLVMGAGLASLALLVFNVVMALGWAVARKKRGRESSGQGVGT